MEIEEKLREVLKTLSLSPSREMAVVSKTITTKYKANKGGSGGILTTLNEAKTYAQVRMMATFACVKKVIDNLQINKENGYSLLDAGFGTGAGTLALCDALNITKVLAIEKVKSMINLGKEIIEKTLDDEFNVEFKNEDLLKYDAKDQFDIVLLSFVLNELDLKRAKDVVRKLFKNTKKYLIIIDPGTPKNHRQLMELKDCLIGEGAFLIAPCKCEKCPLLEGEDWCRFRARVRRSSVHRKLKQGSSSYEDEKFTYLVFSKENEEQCFSARVIRLPVLGKGRISHTVCTNKGIKRLTFSKSRQGEGYKHAKEVTIGDEINL